MKKYISLISIIILTSISWVFAYSFNKTPSELLYEYIQTKCWIQNYGYSERVTYKNYKKIWDNICSFVSIDLPKEDATMFADFLDEILIELRK